MDSIIHHLGDVIGRNRAPNIIGHFEIFVGVAHKIPPLYRGDIRWAVRVEQFSANVARGGSGAFFVEHIVPEYLEQKISVQRYGIATRTAMPSNVILI